METRLLRPLKWGECIWCAFLRDKPSLASEGVKQCYISLGPYPALVKWSYAEQGPGTN